MKTDTRPEKSIPGTLRARHAVTEDLTAGEIEARETEKSELLARLEAHANDDPPDPPPVVEVAAPVPGDDEPEAAVSAEEDAQTMSVVSGLQARSAEAQASQAASDADLLASARARIAPVYEAAKLAAREMRALQRKHASVFETLSHVDFRYLRGRLAGTVWHRRVGTAESALTAVLDGFRNFTAWWERLQSEVSGLTTVKLAMDRTLLATIERDLLRLSDHPYSMGQDLFRLRETIGALDAALKSSDGERPIISEDARATSETASENRASMRQENPSLPETPREQPVHPAPKRDRSPFEEK